MDALLTSIRRELDEVKAGFWLWTSPPGSPATMWCRFFGRCWASRWAIRVRSTRLQRVMLPWPSNSAAQLIQILDESRKTYVGRIRLGEATDTGDLTGSASALRASGAHPGWCAAGG